jgi:hypothetical protein
VLAMHFDEIGEAAKAAEAREMVKQLPPKKNKKRDRPPTPPGWSATGESLAQPRELSEESKAILAERAARKHAEAAAWALEQKDVDEQVIYIYEYSRYWPTHPDLFQQRIWDSDQSFDAAAWGQQHLGDFHLVNGLWVRGAAE